MSKEAFEREADERAIRRLRGSSSWSGSSSPDSLSQFGDLDCKGHPKAIDVATRFGATRAYRWVGAGTPVVFHHGMTDTSVRWILYAEALDGLDVYAIDIMGDVGRSEPDIGFTTADDYPTWLDWPSSRPSVWDWADPA